MLLKEKLRDIETNFRNYMKTVTSFDFLKRYQYEHITFNLYDKHIFDNHDTLIAILTDYDLDEDEMEDAYKVIKNVLDTEYPELLIGRYTFSHRCYGIFDKQLFNNVKVVSLIDYLEDNHDYRNYAIQLEFTSPLISERLLIQVSICHINSAIKYYSLDQSEIYSVIMSKIRENDESIKKIEQNQNILMSIIKDYPDEIKLKGELL